MCDERHLYPLGQNLHTHPIMSAASYIALSEWAGAKVGGISPSGGRIRNSPRPYKRRVIPVQMYASAWTTRALRWVTYDALMVVNAPREAARSVASQTKQKYQTDKMSCNNYQLREYIINVNATGGYKNGRRNETVSERRIYWG